MKIWYATVACLFLSLSISAQNKFWSDRVEPVLHLETASNANIFPQKRKAVNLDFDRMKTQLEANAPKEFTTSKGFVVYLPMPDGSAEPFELFYSPIFEQELQDKYPDIRSYKGTGVNHPKWTTRLTVSPIGLKGSIFTSKGEIYIDPFVHGKNEAHASYYVKDYPQEVHEMADFGCGNSDPDHSPIAHFDFSHLESMNSTRSAGPAANLRTFRVAIATVGEWTVQMGGKDDALARVAASVDRLNLVYERDAGVRLILVGNNDQVIFTDPQTDPYQGGKGNKSGRTLISMNTEWLNNLIGFDNYDVGHVFPLRCNDVGGVARLGSLCQAAKGAGTTCWYQDNLDYIVVRVFCHEMGHQFSAQHTMNLCDNDNENLATGYEPGSGSTIMSYGGLCGSNNVVAGAAASRDITYFHANSVMSISSYARLVSCGNTISTSNSSPEVELNHPNGFTVPVLTPYAINATAMDMEGDSLTYCFEQHDFGLKSCPLGMPTGSCPAFRSFPPNNDPYRVLPRFSSIWNNQTFSNRNEVLVDYTREMNFVVTVRDNNPETGAFGMDTMTFYTDENSGPFIATYPNNGEEQIAGDIVEITWDVANTNQQPVNCRAVDILLYNSSTWGDYTVLKAGTENDGSEWITMPDAQDNVRIMVRASDNIFFDITNRAFDIVESTNAGYGWGISPNYDRICLPNSFTTKINTAAFGGFNGNITFDVISGLPAGATYAFSQLTVEASESVDLTIDLKDVEGKQDLVIEVQGVSDSGDTLVRTINLELISNDYSDLVTVSPASGSQGEGQNPMFTWDGVIDADLYNFQLATDPSFSPGSIVQEDFNLSATEITLNDILDRNTIYFWRVQGVNVCGEGPWTVPSVFSTESSSCKVYTSQDINVPVPKNQTTEYNLTIDVDAEINDLNVENFELFCDQLQDAAIMLRSPQGTEIALATNKCGNTTQFDCRFDDIGGRLRCPPVGDKTYRPQGDITKFNGERAIGKWVLTLDISNFASSVELQTWSLEVCVNQTLDAPYLVNNDTLKMKPSENSKIKNVILLTQDDNNGAEELTYSMLSEPIHGEIQLNGTVLRQGSTFTQADLDNGSVTYNQLSGVNDLDSFIFTVDDGTGGWTGAHTFNINANEDFPSSSQDLEFKELFALYPNPTNGQTKIFFFDRLTEDVVIEVHNLQGQIIQANKVNNGTKAYNLDLNSVSDGVYLVKTQIGEAFFVEKITVKK